MIIYQTDYRLSIKRQSPPFTNKKYVCLCVNAWIIVDSEPSIKKLKSLFLKSYERFEKMRKNANYTSDTVIIIES